MKKMFVFILVIMCLNVGLFGSEEESKTEPAGLDIKVGYISIPRPFVHAGKDYARGAYYITLTEKEGVPYFNVFNRKKELLFEEMAVVQPYKARNKNFKYRIRKGYSRGGEYFRLRVIQPDSVMSAFFLIKKKTPAPPKTGADKDEKKEQKDEAVKF
jgi:hypothetical protein